MEGLKCRDYENKGKPILFNTDMVKAILEGHKTKTRRIIKPQPKEQLKCVIQHEVSGMACWMEENADQSSEDFMFYKSFEVGDILWVRETWGNWTYDNPENNAVYYQYKADYPEGAKTYMFDDEHECDLPKWHPSIHMPRSAARLFLKVTNVRPERLQGITIDGIEQEGIPLTFPLVKLIDSEHLKRFINLWDGIYSVPTPVKEHGIITHYESYPWEDIQEVKEYKGLPWYVWGNPWVWVNEFEKLDLCEHGISDYCQKSSGCTYCTEDMI